MKMKLNKQIKVLVKNTPNDYRLGSKIRMLYSERKHNTSEENKTARG
jgi:hypothetical protein|tara:strand:- start:42 stop:182 length:141 start_codon:yes stop_codon:yes gene_type:complete